MNRPIDGNPYDDRPEWLDKLPVEPKSLRCRLRIHKWENPEEVRDDSIVTASAGIEVIAAYRYVYTCKRCGVDSDTHYGKTNQGKTDR